MATAMAAKPSAPHQQGKMKRPPPPAVQTNGIQPSQTSPSPSTASKRLPSASFKAPPTPTVNGVNGNVNGVQPRLSNRRKDGQRPGETQGRTRTGKDGQPRPPKNRSEPYIKDQAHILKKYKGVAPSLTIHLHPTLFRFDQQDGSFSYNSPMRFVLEHLRDQTVPHDMIEELNQAGVKFYEGCLIVQVKDHRNAKGEGSASTSETDAKDANKPFSIHNYSNFVTPSPYVPYPEKNASPNGTPEKHQPKDGQSVELTNGKQKATEPEPKTYTVVLFPTPLSMQEEVIIQSMTPDMRPGNRKQGGAVPRTPASATVPATPTGLVPPTPGFSGPQAKRQKMSISGNEVIDFEGKIITANAAPLFLEPAKDLEDSQQILEKLTDPLHKKPYPAPKCRKRTVAELAADEAQAASEQAFMLIMDERFGSDLSASGAKAGSSDETGTAPFQPSFERFNLIQQLKKDIEQRAREKQMHDADVKRQKDKLETERNKHAAEQQALRVQQMQQEQQLRIRQQARNQEMQKQAQQNQIAHAAAAAQHQLALAQNNMHHGHPNGMMVNGMGVSQAQHSSPIVRNATPHSNPSPVVGNLQQGGVPMGVTSSGQGGNVSSPQRPPSAVQHSNSTTQSMARQQSRNPVGQPSRTSTPLVNSTPNVANVTPHMGNATPTSRMQQGSPTNPGMLPMMPSQNIGNPQMNGKPNGMPAQFNQMTPQQQAHWIEVQRRRQQQQQQQMLALQQQQQGHHPQTPNGGQMSPEQQRAAMQQMVNQRQQMQQAYQQQLAQHHAPGAHGHPGQLPNGTSPHPPQTQQPIGQPGHPQPGHPQQLQQRTALTPAQQKQREWQHQHMQRELHEIANTKYNGQFQMITNEDKLAAQQHASAALMQLMQKEKIRAHHLQQQQRQNAAMVQNMQHLQAMQQGGQHVGPMAGMARGGGGGQAMTQQQMMQQMAQLPQVGGNGMAHMNMNGMNMGMGNGMNGGGMNINGMNGGMGNGMGGMQ